MIVYELQSDSVEYDDGGVRYFTSYRAARSNCVGDKNARIDRIVIPPITRAMAVNMLNRQQFIQERETLYVRGHYESHVGGAVPRTVDATL